MPEKEADHLTPATRLLEKKREMAEVEQALQATKDVWIIHPVKNCRAYYNGPSLNISSQLYRT